MVDRENDQRHDEIWTRLTAVTDPELDEPVTELGFVEHVEIDPDNNVRVDFRLPTYWCAANFAFLMIDDIRRAVDAVPWVSNVSPRLLDHMYSDAINSGAEKGHSFKQTFADLAIEGNLDDIRQKFRVKAFQRRQEAVLRGLLDQGCSPPEIVAMTHDILTQLAITESEGARQKPRYLQILGEFGFAKTPGSLAFITSDGTALTVEGFNDYLLELRGVRINMEFNGAICRGLLSTRYKEANLDNGEPTLVDFMLDRVPPRVDRQPSRTGQDQ